MEATKTMNNVRDVALYGTGVSACSLVRPACLLTHILQHVKDIAAISRCVLYTDFLKPIASLVLSYLPSSYLEVSQESFGMSLCCASLYYFVIRGHYFHRVRKIFQPHIGVGIDFWWPWCFAHYKAPSQVSIPAWLVFSGKWSGIPKECPGG